MREATATNASYDGDAFEGFPVEEIRTDVNPLEPSQEDAERDARRILEEEERGAKALGDKRTATRNRTNLVYHCTDLGNAERFADQHQHRHRYCGQTDQWFGWTSTHWKVDTTGEVYRLASRTARNIYREAAATDDDAGREQLVKWAKASESRPRLEAMIFLARSMDGVAIEVEELDRDIMAFNCLNGTVNLETGELRKHDPDDLITRCAPVRFDAAAVAPLWDQFLRRIFDGDQELIEFVQRVLGMSLTGDVREQFLYILFGQGANGKSVLLDMFAFMLGDYAGAAAPDLLVSKKHGEHPTELADLQGKRAVIASELESGATWRLQLIKRLTGDATIKARRMRQDFYEFQRTHKLLVVTNSKPRVTEDSEATWRRLRLIPFQVVIPKADRDPKLLDKLKNEAAGILNWHLRGCLDWQQKGLPEPAAVVEATSEYRSESDPLRDFISDCCELDPDGWTSNSELRQIYERHCMENGAKALGKMRFADALSRHGCHAERTWQGRGWKGLTLIETPAMSTNDDPTRLIANSPPHVKTNRQGRHGPTCDAFGEPLLEPGHTDLQPEKSIRPGTQQQPTTTDRLCPECGEKMVAMAEPIGQFVNLDCLTPGCEHVEAIRVEKLATLAEPAK